MAETQQKLPPAVNGRLVLCIVLAVVLGQPTAKAVLNALEPRLGYWGGFVVSMAAAGLATGLLASAVARFMGWDWRLPLILGLAMGLGLSVVDPVRDKALTNILGYWGAFSVSLIAAVGTAALVVMVASWLTKAGSRDRS